MSQGIYQIRNTKTGKVYVGMSYRVEKRWAEHLRDLRAGTHCNKKLQSAWKKSGEKAFVFEVLELVENEPALRFCEKAWFAKTGCRKSGYNIAPAGSGFAKQLSVDSAASRRTYNQKRHDYYMARKAEKRRSRVNLTSV